MGFCCSLHFYAKWQRLMGDRVYKGAFAIPSGQGRSVSLCPFHLISYCSLMQALYHCLGEWFAWYHPDPYRTSHAQEDAHDGRLLLG